MTIRPVGAEFYVRTERQTDGRRQRDMTKLTVPFRNFANAPRNEHTTH